MSMTGCGGDEAPRPAEVDVLTGPRFWTGDPARPFADALVLSQGRIVRLADRDEIPKLIAQGGSVRQLPGVLAVPGLTDAHGHLLGYALTRTRADLVGAATLDEALARAAAFARAHPDAAWVLGRGWDQNDWPDRTWPDADRLEQVVAGRPAALSRVDGHALWVNRTALAAAGIGPETPDPPGGAIHRDANGRPTGILVDNAADLVAKVIPDPTDRERDEALAAAAADLTRMGLTGVHEMGGDRPAWESMRRVAAAGRLPLRVTVYADVGSALHRDLLDEGPQDDGRLRVVGVKIYADGALGSRGARLLAPYADAPQSQGLWVTDPTRMRQLLDEALARGLQPAVHAIGDGAARAVLDACVAAAARDGGKARAVRPRIEHAQVVDPADRGKFRACGAIASMQPTHATSDMPWVEERLGRERVAGAYAWRSLRDAGAPLAFGSDYPVESPDPRAGLYAAVTRQDAAGNPHDGFTPGERLPLDEALRAFSAGAAYAAHQEDVLGRLAPGYWADVTVFDRDLFSVPPSELLSARVTATVIGGQVVAP